MAYSPMILGAGSQAKGREFVSQWNPDKDATREEEIEHKLPARMKSGIMRLGTRRSGSMGPRSKPIILHLSSCNNSVDDLTSMPSYGDGLIDEQLEKGLIGSMGDAGGCEQGEQGEQEVIQARRCQRRG